MPCRNRVDPFGDLHAVPARGLFTGNRGCLADPGERVVRHHRGNPWITCVTEFRGRRVGELTVLTPPTSVAALAHGFVPTLHPSARTSDAFVG